MTAIVIITFVCLLIYDHDKWVEKILNEWDEGTGHD